MDLYKLDGQITVGFAALLGFLCPVLIGFAVYVVYTWPEILNP